MKKITEMSDSQKEKMARWVPSIVSILIAAGSFVFNYGFASAKLEAQDRRVTALESKQQNYEVLVEKMKKVFSVIKWVAMMCSISGNYFVNQKMVLGMWIWLVGSTIWLFLSIKDKKWQESIMFAVYTIYNIQGVYIWGGF